MTVNFTYKFSREASKDIEIKRIYDSLLAQYLLQADKAGMAGSSQGPSQEISVELCPVELQGESVSKVFDLQ